MIQKNILDKYINDVKNFTSDYKNSNLQRKLERIEIYLKLKNDLDELKNLAKENFSRVLDEAIKIDFEVLTDYLTETDLEYYTKIFTRCSNKIDSFYNQAKKYK